MNSSEDPALGRFRPYLHLLARFHLGASYFAVRAGDETMRANAKTEAEGRARDETEATGDRAAVAEGVARKHAAEEAVARRDSQRAQVRAERELDRAEGLLYASRLALAERAWEAGDIRHARELLNACRWDMRGWEHAYLSRLADASEVVLSGHTESINGLTFHPDGKLVATASNDKTVKLWDAATGVEVRTLRGTPCRRSMWSSAPTASAWRRPAATRRSASGM